MLSLSKFLFIFFSFHRHNCLVRRLQQVYNCCRHLSAGFVHTVQLPPTTVFRVCTDCTTAVDTCFRGLYTLYNCRRQLFSGSVHTVQLPPTIVFRFCTEVGKFSTPVTVIFTGIWLLTASSDSVLFFVCPDFTFWLNLIFRLLILATIELIVFKIFNRNFPHVRAIPSAKVRHAPSGMQIKNVSD